MKKQRLPKRWTQKQIRELAEYHDRQTEAEQAKEIEDAISAEDRTLMVVPTTMVPEIQALISRKLGV